MSSFGWAHIAGSAITASLGVDQSLQFKTGETNISGSDNLMFMTASNELRLTGSLKVSGTIQADNYNIVNTTVTFLSASGDSKFGNTSGDRHQFTGSILTNGKLLVGTTGIEPQYALHVYSTVTEKPQLVIENANADEDGSFMHFYKSTSGVADGDDIGTMHWTAKNASNATKNYVTILGEVTTKTAGSEDGKLSFNTMRGGTSKESLTLYGGANGGVVINEVGDGNYDFRVESSSEDEAIFLDSSEDTLYINKGETGFLTVISNTNDEVMRVNAAGVVFNEDGHATNDFRVESDNRTHMLFVDSGNDRVGIGADTPESMLHIQSGSAGTIAAVDNAVLILESSEKPKLQFQSPNAYGGTIVFGSVSDSDEGQIDYDHGSDRFLFKTGGSTKMAILGNNVGIGVSDPDQALEVAGIVHISSEQGSTPSAPSDGDGGLLYTKADGKVYWRSNELSETDLTSGGAVSAVANGSDNRIATFSSSDALNGEASLTFDGTKIQISGGVQHKRVHKTSDYTAQTSDYFIGVNTVGGAVTITLPAASATGDGQEWIIKDEGGYCTGSNNITITGSHASNTIDGEVSHRINSERGAINIYSDGATKYFIF